MWNPAFSFTIKHRVAAFKAFSRFVRLSLLTDFHGTWMDLGDELSEREHLYEPDDPIYWDGPGVKGGLSLDKK